MSARRRYDIYHHNGLSVYDATHGTVKDMGSINNTRGDSDKLDLTDNKDAYREK